MAALITVLIMELVVFGIPGVLTVWNIYNLCAKVPKKEALATGLTLTIGGILYISLYEFTFETAGDWNEALLGWQHHYSISSQYKLSVILPAIIGFCGLLILCNCNTDKLPPLVCAISIASVIMLNILQIVFAVQISKNVSEISLMLYVYIYVILGQGVDAPVKAFTDTADWTFSKQVPPPLEWLFLIFLYMFDLRPEQRIIRQYLYRKS